MRAGSSMPVAKARAGTAPPAPSPVVALLAESVAVHGEVGLVVID